MSRVRAVVERRHGLRQVAIVLAAFWAYEGLRVLMEPDWAVALENAQRIAALERQAGLYVEGALQDAFMALPSLVEAMNFFYFFSHFGLSIVFFVWLYHRSRPGFRSFRDAFLFSTAIAVAIHWLYPTAPPRLAEAGVQDTLLALSGIDIGSPASAAISNPVAAVPSLHAAWAFGVGYGLLLYARHAAWRVVAFVYPLLVLLTIVVTGNHYVFDAVAGAAVLAAGFALGARVRRRRRLAYCTP